MNTSDSLEAQIRAILVKHAKLGADAGQLEPDADLYLAGMSSHASVNVMLALEAAFDIEFPDHLLKRSVFASIDSIRAAVDGIGAGQPS
ncbi:MAG: acyl carrier protein [Burkholderiaceae bacterium]